MSKRRTPIKSKNQTVSRDSIPWKYCFLTLACGLMLVVGFFFAARAHFASIDFGIKNSRLRKQIEELEADKRRLILSKEIALSPAEIKKAAKKIGLREMTAANLEVYRPVQEEKMKPEKALIEKPKLEFLEKSAPVKKEEKKAEAKVEKKTTEIKEKVEKKTEKPEKNKVQIAKK